MPTVEVGRERILSIATCALLHQEGARRAALRRRVRWRRSFGRWPVKSLFDRAYQRLGPRYPIRLLGVAVRLEYVVVVLGVAGLGLYVPVSLPDFLLLAALAIAGQEGYGLLVLRFFRPRLVPV